MVVVVIAGIGAYFLMKFGEEEKPGTAVTLDTPTDTTENSAMLSWSQSTAADFVSYEIYRSMSSGVLGDRITTITDKATTSFTVTGLSPDTTYYFTVRIDLTGGVYKDSNQVSVKTLQEEVENQPSGGPTFIAETYAETMRLDVPHVYDGCGTLCYLGSLAMLLENHDPSLDYQKICVYTGVTQFAFGEIDLGFDARGIPDPETAFLRTPANLGYSIYAGYVGGNLNGFMQWFLGYMDDQNEVSFSSESEAFDYLRRVITSGYPVLVHLDEEYLLHQNPASEPTSHFMPVTGYDVNYVYLNDPGAETEATGKDKQVSINTFMTAWERGENAAGPYFGPYFLLFLNKTGSERSTSEIMADLKTYASQAPANLNSFAQAIIDEGLSGWDVWMPGVGGLVFRDAVASFLENQGFSAAAQKYREAASLYQTLGPGLPPSQAAQIYRNIATVENEAYNLWS